MTKNMRKLIYFIIFGFIFILNTLRLNQNMITYKYYK